MNVEVVLFDVGGVLVEVTGVGRLKAWTDPSHSDDQIWERWLGSEAVRAFERGRITGDEFAGRLIEEFRLPVGRQTLLDEFSRWISGPSAGAHDLLGDLPTHVRKGTLSNSNPLHWPRIIGDMGLGGVFDHHFVSHLTGFVKPDPEAFEHAIGELGCRAGAVVFVDDNQMNVDAAASLGIRAHRTRGAAEARRVLETYNLLETRSTDV